MSLVYLDRAINVTFHQQVYNQVRTAILDGRLSQGTRLPSSRYLAAELGIARIVVLEAYDRLLAEGYLETRKGSGTFVNPALPSQVATPARSIQALPLRPRDLLPSAAELFGPDRAATIDFRPGVPALDQFPYGRWARTVTEQWRHALPGMLDYGPATGRKGLRAALARYLARARGLPPTATERIVITNGTAQAIDLIARSCIAPGAAVAVEDPCSPVVLAAFREREARVVPIPVDEQGIRTDCLPRGPGAPRLLYVTPSHQYPLGGTLSLERRLHLLAWAEEQQALIIEDDYDSEFRYEGDPVPPIASIDRLRRVAYLGTFSKTFFPALRIGYAALPEPLLSAFAAQKWQADRATHSIEQGALAEWLDNGQFERHVRRMRRTYVERRQALVDSLRLRFGVRIRLHGASAGLHLCVSFHLGLSEQELIDRADQAGVRLYPTSSCFLQTAPSQPMLSFGYGGLNREQIERGVELLARSCQP